jgi:phosphatidylserine/phosphatidylglycerophosphate/cardiolipin synthase-like enzyme
MKFRNRFPLFLLCLILSGCQLSSDITIYFNDPLAGLPLMTDLKAQANGIDQALIKLIESAKETIDAAIYSIDDRFIKALEEACLRGVRVRLIVEAQVLEQEREFKCVNLKKDKNERLMHHKFMVVDGKITWTGSLNWTKREIYFNANNALKIIDRALAEAFTLEFEEMFIHDRWGQSKEDNNEETFKVGRTSWEVYFTSDFPQRAILEAIRKAQRSIHLAMFYYTDDLLHKALVDALNRGVTIKAVWDFRGWENFSVSEMDEMLARGIGVIDANPGLVHHKFAVIDSKIVITGSANWSKSGMNYNDENTLIIHSPDVAGLFIDRFNRLYQDALNYDKDPTQPPRVTVHHHNTQDVKARVEWRPHLTWVDFYEICRSASSMGECELIFKVPGDHRYWVDETAREGVTYYYRLRGSIEGIYTDYSNEYVIKVEPLELSCPSVSEVEVEGECSCADGVDNDGNGYIDCDDFDCAVATACLGPKWPKPQGTKVVPGVLPAREIEEAVEKYLGKLVTVQLHVIEAYDSGKAIFLNSGPNWEEDFTAVIFNRDIFKLFGINPLDYENKTIQVTGTLKEYNGPQIILEVPWQVEIE